MVVGEVSGCSGGDLHRAGFVVFGLGLALGWAWPIFLLELYFQICVVWPLGFILF